MYFNRDNIFEVNNNIKVVYLLCAVQDASACRGGGGSL